MFLTKEKNLKNGASEGWLSEDFLGFQDNRRMMDTNDPFLADLVMWAEAIGISMTENGDPTEICSAIAAFIPALICIASPICALPV